MAFTKQLRSWFFRKNAPINKEGKKINFQDNQRPDQDAFERLTASALFFTETEDRAKQSTGGVVEDEVGHVAITTDAKAKANTDGLEADRTLVPTAKHLPTSAANSETIDDFTGDVLEVTVDAGVTTRNNFLFNLSASFSSWLLNRLLPGGGTVGQVLSKISGTDYDVQWIDAPSSGEVNLASNVGAGGGTGDIFKDKTGVVLNFRALRNVGYINFTTVVDNVDVGVDEVGLLAYMQSNLVFPPGSSNTFSNLGAGAEVFKQVNGIDVEHRTIVAGDGVIITEETNEIAIEVDPVYIEDTIEAIVGNDRNLYAYNVETTSDMVVPDLSSNSIISFNQENSDPGGTFFTTQWVANTAAEAAPSVTFTLSASINVTASAGGGSTEQLRILKNGAIIGSTPVDCSSLGVTGVVVNVNTTVVQGDIISAVADSTNSIGSSYTVLSGATFSNV